MNCYLEFPRSFLNQARVHWNASGFNVYCLLIHACLCQGVHGWFFIWEIQIF
jgi:hypothetical protein